VGLPSTIIVIGASAGGLSPLKTIVSQLSTGIDAAVFAVQHVDPAGPALLAEVLGRESSLPVTTARHGELIERGRIYTAPPGRHLMFRDGKIELVYGTKVNFTRPSIDVAFRSAAKECGPRAIGVILSGYLDDGTAGLLSIKRAGGLKSSKIRLMPKSIPCRGRPSGTASQIIKWLQVRLCSC
jgi:two-component system chemotaxis response regulator CheB